MRLTFLGTGDAEGYPNPFCDGACCRRARALGGPSLRRRSAALVDDGLLLDLGPDVGTAAHALGVSLLGLRWCLQTHEHGDHLDPTFLLFRTPRVAVHGAPLLDFYASRAALDRIAALLPDRVPAGDGIFAPEVTERLNVRANAVAPGTTFAVGPYRVTAILATHNVPTPLLYAIERDGRSLFYATDTGPLPEAGWAALRRWRGRFDVVAMDHTNGVGERGTAHLNGEQFREQIARLGEEGLLAEGCRVFAHHIAHHGNPAHPDLVAEAAAHGYEVPFDGQVIEV